MSGRVLLVRHPPVARAWAGRCYGQSDMGWSRAGMTMARGLADDLAREAPDMIVHSGLSRTARLAAMIAARTGAPSRRDERWMERDFGDWEGRRWESIWRETGNLMDRMATDPDTFQPGGGDTTSQLVTRTRDAWADLPRRGTIVVIAHGGSIAAVRSLLAGSPIDELIRFVPQTGSITAVARS